MDYLAFAIETARAQAAEVLELRQCDYCEAEMAADGSDENNADWVGGATLCRDCWGEWVND